MAAMAAMAEMAVKAEKAEKAMSDDLRDSSESFVEICSRKGIETHERHRQEIVVCVQSCFAVKLEAVRWHVKLNWLKMS